MKTIATISQESVLANIDGDKLKNAFIQCCAVARGEKDPGELAAIADDVHDLQVLADKFKDLSDAISESVKNANGKYFEKNGDVVNGFKLKNTGYTVTVIDSAALIAEAELNGYNVGRLHASLKLSATDAKKAMGIDDERFKAEFGDYIEVKKKADSLIRAW